MVRTHHARSPRRRLPPHLTLGALPLAVLVACGPAQPPVQKAAVSDVLSQTPAAPAASDEAKSPAEDPTFALAVQSEGADVFFEMEAPFERQRGSVPARAVSGTLTIDPGDLAKSRGLVNVDITELEIYMQRRGSEDEAYGEREKNENQNKHMRAWLEIGEDAPPEQREKNRLMQFALERMEGLSMSSLDPAAAEQTVTFTGVGPFRLHQRSAEARVELEATLIRKDGHWTTATVKTTSPLTIHLDTYDVRPRKGFGVLAAKTLEAMAPKVAKEVQISAAFSATVGAPRVAERSDASKNAPADGPAPAG